MLTLRKRALAALASLALLFGLGSATALPAQATISEYQVCNSTASVGHITVWSTQAWFAERTLPKGYCQVFGHVSTIRVDVDPEYGNDGDVDSYYIGVIGQGYGPCHDSENPESDPPDDAPNGVRYNTNAGHCP
jgi:hypothetical protein